MENKELLGIINNPPIPKCRRLTRPQINQALDNMDEAYELLSIHEIRRHIPLRPKALLRLKSLAAKLIDIWENTDFRNQLYDRKSMGLGLNESISAVAAPLTARWSKRIPEFKEFLKAVSKP